MKTTQAVITEIWQSGSGNGGMLQVEPAFTIAPGQYIQLWRSLGESALPMTAYATSLADKGQFSVDNLPPHWMPGEKNYLFGPLGHGFSLPPGVKFVALVCPGGNPMRLMPLAHQALAQSAAVTLFIEQSDITDALVADLPLEIEVQPISALPDALQWADYISLDLDITQLPVLDSLLGLDQPTKKLPSRGQVLIRVVMPCTGKAKCGICAVHTCHGLRYACEDGPVFDLEDLIHVAG
jgi:hypothetical protein